ncbi:hypothetical protein FJZ20_00855 [Candidatus Pacearchaeota archaeon]|nr:hypothetical protein [Candidatus Pacearchaeota archaeon]
MVKKEINSGFSFGLTSGVITTLGLMIGLYSGTNSRLAIIGGILVIAFADSFSDSLGIHMSKEAEKGTTKKKIWNATTSSFIAKLIIALTFLIPVLLFNLNTAVIISVIWGLLLLNLLSYKIAKSRKQNVLKRMGEHSFIAIIVIVLSGLIGKFVANFFGTF